MSILAGYFSKLTPIFCQKYVIITPMKRHIYQRLCDWKTQRQRLPLILRGARQVGKSHVVEIFGKNEFEHCVVANFELQPELSECFTSLDPKDIIPKLELYLRTDIIPGKTLLFLDEIQQCPLALQALRYFKEKVPDLHVIAAGSLLEFLLRAADFSFPVGRVQFAYMYPMSLSEYLLNNGEERLSEFLKTITLENLPPISIHKQALQQVREYMLLGGMPAVVDQYIHEKSFIKVQALQSSLLVSYENDFGKYGGKMNVNHLRTLYKNLPYHISEQIKYANIMPDLRAEESKKLLNVLEWAGIISRVEHSAASGVPLSAQVNEKIFKFLFLDIGLLQRANQVNPTDLLSGDILQINSGMLAEQFVGQELLANHPYYEAGKLYFWKRDKLGSQAEIDYVALMNNQIIPIEVKAGKTGRLKSLRQFMLDNDIPLGVRFSQDNLSFENNILTVPFYLLSELPRLLNGLA